MVKTNLYKQILEGLIADTFSAVGAVEAVYPVDNQELAEAIRDIYAVLDEYSKLVFRVSAKDLSDPDVNDIPF